MSRVVTLGRLYVEAKNAPWPLSWWKHRQLKLLAPRMVSRLDAMPKNERDSFLRRYEVRDANEETA